MIRFENVSFNYDSNLILDKFNASFDENKINCIIGASGIGKTTLLNIIAQTLKISHGNITSLSRKISYLFQEERLINEITVYQNLDFILKSIYRDKLKRKSLINLWLSKVGLKNTQDLYPEQLSGSMKRRLSLVRAFLYPSKILLMDEPFIGLDINIKKNIMNMFLKLWKQNKRTVFFVSHDLDEALLLANNIYLMSGKPMKITKMYKISINHNKRFLDNKQLLAIKKSIWLKFK